MIITTAVQFFESIYANKRNKLRKLHNMADSILVLDEAHLMPTKYLQPCLEAISYITAGYDLYIEFLVKSVLSKNLRIWSTPHLPQKVKGSVKIWDRIICSSRKDSI